MNGRIFPADRIIRRAEVAQLVEHATENRGVPSSILGLGTNAYNRLQLGVFEPHTAIKDFVTTMVSAIEYALPIGSL